MPICTVQRVCMKYKPFYFNTEQELNDRVMKTKRISVGYLVQFTIYATLSSKFSTQGITLTVVKIIS
jgi:hypothetical protein